MRRLKLSPAALASMLTRQQWWPSSKPGCASRGWRCAAGAGRGGAWRDRACSGCRECCRSSGATGLLRPAPPYEARATPSAACPLLPALQPLPLFLLGVSSGAAFALKLPMELAAAGTPVHGVISGGAGAGRVCWRGGSSAARRALAAAGALLQGCKQRRPAARRCRPAATLAPCRLQTDLACRHHLPLPCRGAGGAARHLEHGGAGGALPAHRLPVHAPRPGDRRPHRAGGGGVQAERGRLSAAVGVGSRDPEGGCSAAVLRAQGCAAGAGGGPLAGPQPPPNRPWLLLAPNKNTTKAGHGAAAALRRAHRHGPGARGLSTASALLTARLQRTASRAALALHTSCLSTPARRRHKCQPPSVSGAACTVSGPLAALRRSTAAPWPWTLSATAPRSSPPKCRPRHAAPPFALCFAAGQRPAPACGCAPRCSTAQLGRRRYPPQPAARQPPPIPSRRRPPACPPAPCPPQVVAALQSVGLVDSSLLLTEDPRYSRLPWRDAVRAQVTEIAAAQECLEADASHVSGALGWGGGLGRMVGCTAAGCRGVGAGAGAVLRSLRRATLHCTAHAMLSRPPLVLQRS